MSVGGTQKKSKPPVGVRRPPVEKGRWAAKGTKPLPDQASVQHVLSVMLIHICRKVLFIATEVKITLYSISLFFGSLICDFLPIPKVYMSSKDNMFNQYFVKIGWMWTSVIVGTFIYFTSMTYGCGHKEIIKRHMSRLLIGTIFWLFWTQFFFEYVERSTGVCLGKAILKDKYTCVTSGFQWHAFDISGHAFLLVYINLLLVEEAKAILGWEGIRDLLRMEEHVRDDGGTSQNDDKTVLSGLSREDLTVLKSNYENWTPFIRFLFLCMTLMSLLSDVMLACTVIYFHTMPQKCAGGVIAMATWYVTYRYWYKKESSPGLPGKGLFPYQQLSDRSKDTSYRRRSSIVKDSKDTPTFMGMPIYAKERDRRREQELEKEEDRMLFTVTDETDNSRYMPRGDYFSNEPRYRRTKKTN